MPEHRDPQREFINQMLRAMAENIDSKMMGDLSKHGGGFLIPLGAIWTEEDEPMTELAESFVRGSPKVKAECDCAACTAAVKEEQAMWAAIGINIFGKEDTDE